MPTVRAHAASHSHDARSSWHNRRTAHYCTFAPPENVLYGNRQVHIVEVCTNSLSHMKKVTSTLEMAKTSTTRFLETPTGSRACLSTVAPVVALRWKTRAFLIPRSTRSFALISVAVATPLPASAIVMLTWRQTSPSTQPKTWWRTSKSCANTWESTAGSSSVVRGGPPSPWRMQRRTQIV